MLHRYSGLDTAHRCLRRFKLEYIDGIRQKGTLGIDLAFGTGIHAGLQATLEGDDAWDTFSLYWESLHKDYPRDLARYWELNRLAKEFLRKFDKMHAKKFGEGQIETTMRCQLQGLEFEGTADFIGMYDGVPSVIDFKTSQYAYTKEKLLINPQMPLYAEMARHTSGFVATQLVYYVFVKATGSIQVISTPLSKSLLTRAVDRCIVMAKDIEGRKEWPENYTACQMGKHLCPHFERCYK